MRSTSNPEPTLSARGQQPPWTKLLSVLLALLVWQLAAGLVQSHLLLVSPWTALVRLVILAGQGSFWLAVFHSLGRILLGFTLALVTGIGLAILSARWHLVDALLWPYMAAIKATPVASFIILCLIWLDSRSLSVFISFLMVLPIIYASVLQGIRSTDIQLLEMATVFRVSRWRRLIYIYLPQLRPFLIASCTVATGLAWKAGIAAEVIGIPAGTIGERLYQAKIYLDTGDLFAWTIVVVGLSILVDKAIVHGLDRMFAFVENR